MVLGIDFGMVLLLDSNLCLFRQTFHCVKNGGGFFGICRRLNHLVSCNRLHLYMSSLCCSQKRQDHFVRSKVRFRLNETLESAVRK